ncbi:MAG TPA: nucleotide exchange factor GrpE [Candidatus Cybelea sp.]|nr:nucleotide exchange factor GrpE [Candidatus Cybelea sp.]
MPSHPSDPEKKNVRGDEPERAVTRTPSDRGSQASGAEPAAGEAVLGNESGAAASLELQARKLQAEKEDLMNTLVRLQADFENYRKRVEKERHADRHRGVEALIDRLLPVLDAFDRALGEHGNSVSEEHRRGFELIRRQLWDALSKQGLVRIEAVGKEFDPHQHHAIERVETAELPDGTVMSELQAGYKFHDRVLRPAMVRVAAQPVSNSAAGN